MRAFQREIGQTMVEGVGIQMHDIGIAADVIRVAGLAGQLFNIIDAAVKTALIVDVRRHLLMAIETQVFLRGLAEGLVAFAAGRFIFGMGVYHLSRHDQGFEAGCGRR